MSKTAVLKKFEMMVILDANSSTDEKEKVYKQAMDIISKEGGKVINSSVWQEKQKFTFNLKKCTEGTYYLINFESDGSKFDEIKSNLKLNEKILRHIIIQK